MGDVEKIKKRLRPHKRLGNLRRGADITGCDIDFSSWPLWCESKGVIVDERIFRQLVDHLLAVVVPNSEEASEAQRWLKDHVGRSHRAEELGLIPGEKEEE